MLTSTVDTVDTGETEAGPALGLSETFKEIRRMRARAVHYTLKTDRWDDAQSALRSILDEMRRQDGLETYTNVANPETGHGTVLAVFATSEAHSAAAPALKSMLSMLDAYMKLTPIVQDGDVVAQIVNTPTSEQ